MYLWRAVDHEAEVLDVLVHRGATSARHSGWCASCSGK
jgi:transposase-like protein